MKRKPQKSRLEIFAFRTDRPRDTPSYRDARTHLKMLKQINLDLNTEIERKRDTAVQRLDQKNWRDVWQGAKASASTISIIHDQERVVKSNYRLTACTGIYSNLVL